MYWTSEGGGVSPSHDGELFWILGVLNIIKLKLTSILAPIRLQYTKGGRRGGGDRFCLHQGGGYGREHPRGRDPFEILVQNTSFSCIKNKNQIILPEK